RDPLVTGVQTCALPICLIAFVSLVSLLGVAAGLLGAIYGHSTDWTGLLAIVALVGAGQALALEVDDGSISVSAVGAIAGAALFEIGRASGRERGWRVGW